MQVALSAPKNDTLQPYFKGFAMGLPELAHTLAAQGRGNDRMLVHMEPKELQGLQALAQKHGGSLTINPKTGLPEAGFLSSILPMVAGVGLDVATGGAATPFESALMAGGVGAVGYATSGSLKQGLLDGIGAYGGMGLANSLAGAGAAADWGSTVPTTGGWGSIMDPTGAFSGVGAGTSAIDSTLGGTSNMASATDNMVGAPGATGTQSGVAANSPAAGEAQTVAPSTTQSTIPGTNAVNAATQNQLSSTQQQINLANDRLSNMSAGLTNVTSSGSNALNFLKNNWKYGAAAGLPMLAAASQQNTMPGAGPATIRPFSFNQTSNPNFGQPGQAYFNQGFTAGTPYNYTGALSGPGSFQGNIGYAHGGITNINQLRTLHRDMIPIIKSAGGGALGSYSDGGHLLSGPGTGLSDDIPANINGKQPARLASGEFVIPADAVSALGGGSTESGASKLYSMLDRVRQQAHGNKKQIKEVDDKALPA